MAKFIRRKRVYRRPAKKSVVKKAVRKVSNQMFRKKVLKVLSSKAETKEEYSIFQILPTCLQTSTTTISSNYFCCSPVEQGLGWTRLFVPQGVENGQRIGNRITTKRLLLRYTLNNSGFNATTNTLPFPQIVRLFFFKIKGNTTAPPALGDLVGANAQFFDAGTLAGAFTGTLPDLNQVMNNDAYTYLTHRTHKLGYAENTQQPSVNHSNGANNDFKISVVSQIDLTKYCPKQIRYDDLGDCLTPPIWCVIQTLNANGTLLATSQLPIQMNCQLEYRYNDM